MFLSFLLSRKEKWYFVTKIFLTYCEKKNVLLKFEAEDREFAVLEITRAIYSNREKSEQFLITECFFNLFLDVSHT